MALHYAFDKLDQKEERKVDPIAVLSLLLNYIDKIDVSCAPDQIY